MRKKTVIELVYLLLLLFHPLLATTWSLKHLLPFSPLELIGALLVPFFVYALCLQKEVLKKGLAPLIPVLIMGICILISCTVDIVFGIAVDGISITKEYGQHFLRSALFILLPLFGYCYFRKDGFLERYALYLLLAVLFPLSMLYYEIIFGPVNTSMRSLSVRYTGLYAQVSVYATYFVLGVSAALYLAVKKKGKVYPSVLVTLLLALAFAAPYILHLTTYVVLSALTLLALFVFLRFRLWYHAAILPVGVALLFALSTQYSDLGPMASSWKPDIAVLQGSLLPESIANARGFIWKGYIQDWLALPLQAELFGYGFAAQKEYSAALGFGAHNDFLRILFAGGAVGLAVWAFFLVFMVYRIRSHAFPERILLISVMIIWLGYSVALTPSYIIALMLGILPLFGSLLKKDVKRKKVKT